MRDQEPTIDRRAFAIAAGASVAAAALHSDVVAQEATPAAEVEHFDVTGIVHPFSVGSFECLAVSDGSSLNNDSSDPFNFYNLALGMSPPDEVLAALETGGYVRDRLIRQDTFVLVRTGSHTVLIDTGIGAGFGGALLSNLAGEGIEPGDIDVVITTHGHPDHIGGNVDESGAPTFPNAQYVLSAEEWDFWADAARVEQAYPDPAIREPVLGFVNAQMVPMADGYDLIGFDEEIVPGITSIASPGHTPGHMSLLVQSGGERLWIGGDFATHPVTMRHPSFAGYADADPEQMEATRRRLFQRIADEGGMALFDHFDPFPGMGTITVDGDAWRWNPDSTEE